MTTFADRFYKPGVPNNAAHTLTETTLGNTAATPVPPPYSPGQGGGGQLPEVDCLVAPHIADGTPAPAF